MKRIALLALVLLVPVAASADKTKDTARGVARTAADAVVDSGRLVGRSTRALFENGTHAAKQTAKANARATRTDFDANAHATRAAAHEK